MSRWRPPRRGPGRGVTSLAMGLFLLIMTLLAIGVGLAALLGAGGEAGVWAALGPSATALFVVAHMPAMAVGIILSRRYGRRLPIGPRVFLYAATAYFSIACILAFAGNYLLATFFDRFMPGGG